MKIKFIESHNTGIKNRIARFLETVYRECKDDFLTELVLDRFLWTATEDNDRDERVKYLGQPYWSKNAISLYQKTNVGRRRKYFKGLRHEHIVPRNIVKNEITKLKVKSQKNIYRILDKFSHAVVITKEEDNKLKEIGCNNKMPVDSGIEGDILARYKKAQIEILDVTGQNLKALKV